MSTEETELTFIRCPGCRSLVPAVASRCRMCGQLLESSSAAESDEGDGLERKSRVRQRTISVPENSVETLKTQLANRPKAGAREEAESEEPEADSPLGLFASQHEEPDFEEAPEPDRGGASAGAAFSDLEPPEPPRRAPLSFSPPHPVRLPEIEEDQPPSSDAPPEVPFIDRFVKPAAPATVDHTAARSDAAWRAERENVREVVIEEIAEAEDFEEFGEEEADLVPAAHQETGAPEPEGKRRRRRRRRRKHKDPESSAAGQLAAQHQPGFRLQPEERPFQPEISPAASAPAAVPPWRTAPVAAEETTPAVVAPPPPPVQPPAAVIAPPPKTVLPQPPVSAHFGQAAAAPAKPQAVLGQGTLAGWLVTYQNSAQGETFELRSGRFFVTSNKLRSSDFVVASATVSAPHCLVVVRAGAGVLVQDLLSEHGIYLKRSGAADFERQYDEVEVFHGDRIRFGEYEMLVCLVPQP